MQGWCLSDALTSAAACVQPIPAILEIPSKEHPYDASKDSIMTREESWDSRLARQLNAHQQQPHATVWGARTQAPDPRACSTQASRSCLAATSEHLERGKGVWRGG